MAQRMNVSRPIPPHSSCGSRVCPCLVTNDARGSFVRPNTKSRTASLSTSSSTQVTTSSACRSVSAMITYTIVAGRIVRP